MLLRRVFASVVVGTSLLLAPACVDEDVSVKYAPDYRRAPANISFFGLFKDGRANADAWDPVNETLAKSLHGAPCSPFFSTDLLAQNADLAGAIDDYARANGVGDELLAKLAPMAKGDLIAVVVMAGQPPQEVDAGPPPPAAMPTGTARHGASRAVRVRQGPVSDHNAFELAVSLYSIKAHKSVGLIAMSYTGKSVDDALAKFGRRFALETAGSSCTGWNVRPEVDGESIRQLREEER